MGYTNQKTTKKHAFWSFRPFQCFPQLILCFWGFFWPLEKFWSPKIVILGWFWSFFSKCTNDLTLAIFIRKSRKNVFFEAIMVYFHYLGFLFFFRFFEDLQKIFSDFFCQNLQRFWNFVVQKFLRYFFRTKKSIIFFFFFFT